MSEGFWGFWESVIEVIVFLELYVKSTVSNKVIWKPVSSFLNSSTPSSLKYFEATSTGNDKVRSANAN